MIEGQSFLYQDLDEIVYHINKSGVRAIQFWSSGEIMAFIDGDKKDCVPRPMLLLGKKVQVILASSPKGANEKWTEQAGGVKVIVTEPWSPHELFFAGFVLGLLLSTLN
jgi:hypothetical protein